MIQLAEPQYLQPSSFLLFLGKVPSHGLRIDDEILAAQDNSHLMPLDIMFPEDILAPEEAARQRVRDAHVFGSEVVELMFVCADGLTAGEVVGDVREMEEKRDRVDE